MRALVFACIILAATLYYATRPPTEWLSLETGDVFEATAADMGDCKSTVKNGGCVQRKLFVTHILGGVTDGAPITTASHRWRIDLPLLGTYLSSPHLITGGAS